MKKERDMEDRLTKLVLVRLMIALVFPFLTASSARYPSNRPPIYLHRDTECLTPSPL
jgi:hypothetical protein